MANENCLVGIQCPNPECRSDGPFRILAQAWFEVFDSGTSEFTDVAWSEDSAIVCLSCNRQGLVKHFCVKENKDDKIP